MKTLMLIRHAKSEGYAGQHDFDRSLNERGLRDAPAMARHLQEKKMIPQLIVSSTAKRAKTTALLMAKVWEYPEAKITWKPELYHAGLAAFLEVITRLDDEIRIAALFSHNPGISLFANSLTAFNIESIPTCGVVGIRVHTGNWNKFQSAEKEILFFEYPKLWA